MAAQMQKIFIPMLAPFALVITLLFSRVNCAISGGESSCKSAFLLLVSRHPNGTEIAITDGQGHVISDINVKGHFLPVDCEQKEFCRDITALHVNRSQGHQFVAFVPGISSVLILDLRLIGQMLSINHYYRKDVPSVDCSEVGIVTLRESVFASCVNVAEGYLAFMLLKLNASDINGSTISAPVAMCYVQDQISNFVKVTFGSNPDAQQIYFQTGPYLYYCTPLSYSCNYDPIAILPNCPIPYRLAYPSENTMMLYCKEAFVVYVDIQEGAVLNVSSNAEFGQPCISTDRDVRLAVFKASSSYIQFGLWSEGGGVKNVTLRGQNFDSGVCVQVNESTVFIYVDKVDGVYVTDMASETTRLLVDRVCLCNSSFHPLSVIEDHLVVQGPMCGHVSLFGLNQNITRIFEVEYFAETATELVLTTQGDANCSVGTEPVYQRLPSSVHWVAVVAVVPVTIAIVMILIIIFCFYSKRSKQSPIPLQEEGTELMDLQRKNPEMIEVAQDFSYRDPHSPPIQETNSEENSESGWGSESDPLHPSGGDEILVGAATNAVPQSIASKTVQLTQQCN